MASGAPRGFSGGIVVAEPAGPTTVGQVLSARGHRVDMLDVATVDAASQEPTRLATRHPAGSDDVALVLAIAPQAAGGAATVDWASRVHTPLQRCFTIVRGLVPSLVAGSVGGKVIVVLPLTALVADASRCGESVLGRSLIGLFEGLRAELLATDVRVTIVLADPDESDSDLAGRIEVALELGPLYDLPVSLTDARVEALVEPWLRELERTPSDFALPPLGPMGEVYRRELGESVSPELPIAELGGALSGLPHTAGATGWQSVAVPGKTAIVTGGASGIGLGIAEALLERGLNVIIADVRDDHLATATRRLASYGERMSPLRLDVTDLQAWHAAGNAIVDRFGAIDLLCLNAGIGVLGTILESSPADWRWLMGVNLSGVTNGIEAVLPLMRARGSGGHVVATSSAGGLMVANDGGIYSAAKYGVVALMECLANELREEGIGVTTLCPAGVNTNIHDHETMRPEAFSDSGLRGSEADLEKQQAIAREMLSKGADPRAVGDRVLDAVDRNAPILFTDGGIAPVIRLRREALRAAAARR